MRKSMVAQFAALAVCLSLDAIGAAPAAAQPAPMMSMAPIDCSKAGDMMMQAHAMTAPAMTGDVDKDFVANGMVQEKGMMMMMHVEMACGKDPKVKADAAKSMRESEMRLQMFHDQGQS
jgi:hypothetical protein